VCCVCAFCVCVCVVCVLPECVLYVCVRCVCVCFVVWVLKFLFPIPSGCGRKNLPFYPRMRVKISLFCHLQNAVLRCILILLFFHFFTVYYQIRCGVVIFDWLSSTSWGGLIFARHPGRTIFIWQIFTFSYDEQIKRGLLQAKHVCTSWVGGVYFIFHILGLLFSPHIRKG